MTSDSSLLRAFSSAATWARIDAAGQIIDANDRFCTLVGRPREGLIHHGLIELFEGSPEVRLFHQSAVLDAELPLREVVPLRRGAQRIFVEMLVEPILPSENAGSPRETLLLFSAIDGARSAELEVLRTALEDASQATAQRLQFLFDGVPAMIYSAEANGELGVRYMSPNVKTCLGYESKDFIDPTFWLRNVHPEDVAAAQAQAATLRQVKWQSLQYRFRHRDGTYRWMLDECRLVDTQRQRPKIFGYWMDITERKDTEAALRESRERLAEAQAGAQLGGWELDVPQRRYQLDEAALRLLGAGPPDGAAEAVRTSNNRGEKFVEWFHPDDIATFDGMLTQHLIGESAALESEHRIKHHHSGRWLWVRMRGRVVERDAVGLPKRVSGTIVDVTHRKLAEEAALRAQGAVEAATNGMLVVDARSVERGILYANPAFMRITGYTWEEIVGRNCRFLQGTDTDQPELVEIRDALRAHQPCTVTLRNYRKDGELFWNELSISPIVDRAGCVTHFVGVVNDITARRRLEEALRQAQKMEAFGQLAGGVAHDFNNLLTAVLAGASILLDGYVLPPEAAAELHAIAGAAERGADLTRQLLAFSRRSVKANENLDFGELVSNMTRLLRRVLGEHIALESRISPNLPSVRADRGMLDQVLMNLAVNARDAMPQGGRLQILVDEVDVDPVAAQRNPAARPGHFLCLRVNDSGTGIAPAHLPHVFEPFFTTKEVGKGTGLGLATVYGIVLQHHGWIEVQSELELGTQFRVFLPAAEASPREARTPRATTPVHGGRETILVVEDEALVRRSARSLLERLGYAVIEADCGDSAIALLGAHAASIALVFTDMVMPGATSGQKLAELVAANHPSLPVIFTSGYSPDVMGGELPIRPGRNFLQKPYREAELAAAVRAMLDRG